MTVDQFLQVFIAITGGLAIYLIKEPGRISRERWGFTIGAIGQPAWLYVTFTAEQWGLLSLSVFFTWAWFTGARERWSNKRGLAR